MPDPDVIRQIATASAISGGFLVGVSGDYGDGTTSPSMVLPAGYSFSIWTPIYAGLFSHAIYQALPAQRRDPLLRRTGYPLACAVGLSGFWVWTQDIPGLELCLIAATTAAALTAYVRAAPEQHSEAKPESTRDRWLVRIPLAMFSGWITVATVAGGAEAIIATGLRAPWPGAEAWSTAALAAAGGAASAIAWLRPISSAYAGAVAWGLAGVAVRNLPKRTRPGVTAALAGAAVALAAIASTRRR
ncbi:conserved hypothetical protein [Pseudarthrobacter chlorophenolicus A6]|uniref:Uncharacterized protein n=1 Tax=Pseudarthrobacter chlorophenolicus (strain ATCC 700700 / DSM 12829 / CIP 107037 / JCM 12360 / KCTC 9906 / NCIMB 13794 / A6) TaxID=452863 RepID=B8H6W0_PSECP|nr:hypothetical protein [Pseudarthrobacter chlorophenolicus]ACL39681.1 conserved hypothetical protein [Pseudarthrobacter chlorophenolicus A6]SDQ95519.1 hypothetical protein SAMN04489738_3811 [Pseudarthrobacter chlorophenolicus]